jgi:hypothetical protein
LTIEDGQSRPPIVRRQLMAKDVKIKTPTNLGKIGGGKKAGK